MTYASNPHNNTSKKSAPSAQPHRIGSALVVRRVVGISGPNSRPIGTLAKSSHVTRSIGTRPGTQRMHKYH